MKGIYEREGMRGREIEREREEKRRGKGEGECYIQNKKERQMSGRESE